MSLVLLGCADQLIFYFYVVKYNSLDPLCSTIFHCAMFRCSFCVVLILLLLYIVGRARISYFWNGFRVMISNFKRLPSKWPSTEILYLLRCLVVWFRSIGFQVGLLNFFWDVLVPRWSISKQISFSIYPLLEGEICKLTL